MALLEVRGLTKSYGDTDVLGGIDFAIEPGQVVAVIGPSGGGKSTFLRCLNLLETPTSGSVSFDGEELTGRGVDLDRLRSRMGMVFQHFNLFPNMTALRNVVLPQMNVLKRSKEEAEAKARALLERVGMLERAGAYPNRLSGGQKQRVAIVRAAAMDPKLMLFDEPTSALDPRHDDARGHPRDGVRPQGRRPRGLRRRREDRRRPAAVGVLLRAQRESARASLPGEGAVGGREWRCRLTVLCRDR
ncbi:Arginine transport ATP-binding protein ArtM [Amycolatopsis sp. M39]|nr:Arginine transport ATP-binding protein ArtM [Amycolatopsis sp. M39]